MLFLNILDFPVSKYNTNNVNLAACIYIKNRLEIEWLRYFILIFKRFFLLCLIVINILIFSLYDNKTRYCCVLSITYSFYYLYF